MAHNDDQLNAATIMISVFDRVEKCCTIRISVFDRVENIVGKGENAGYQHFLLFLQCFQKPSVSGSLKARLFDEELSKNSYYELSE